MASTIPTAFGTPPPPIEVKPTTHEQTFQPFSHLPYELREKIWIEAAVIGSGRPGMHFFRMFDCLGHGKTHKPHGSLAPACSSRFTLAAPFDGLWGGEGNCSAYVAADALSRTCFESREVVQRLRSRLVRGAEEQDEEKKKKGSTPREGPWMAVGVELSSRSRCQTSKLFHMAGLAGREGEDADITYASDHNHSRSLDGHGRVKDDGDGDDAPDHHHQQKQAAERRRLLVHLDLDLICLQVYDWDYAELQGRLQLPWWGPGFGIPLLASARRVALEYDGARWDAAFAHHSHDGRGAFGPGTPVAGLGIGVGGPDAVAPERMDRSLLGPKWFPAHLKGLGCLYVVDYTIRRAPTPMTGTPGVHSSSSPLTTTTATIKVDDGGLRQEVRREVFHAVGKTFCEVRQADEGWVVDSRVFSFAAWLKTQHHLTKVFPHSPDFKVLACLVG